MSGLIELLDAGFGNSIQDAGRLGYRHMGITVSGALDAVLLRCANALVGHSGDLACIEIRARGPRLVVREGPLRVALVGDVSATLKRDGVAVKQVLGWTSANMQVGDVLEVGMVRGGTAYLAVSGGVDCPVQLGSRSLYQRALIGGRDGRPLARGDCLPCAAVTIKGVPECMADPWHHVDGPIRVIPGPQEGHFKPESVVEFFANGYCVTPQMDRMGVRLDGAELVHATPESADIVSDGVTPGTIQVPGNGQPIILLADCQTVGGYPKIATVISADLPRLAHLAPGQIIRFRAVDAAEAKQARLDTESRWRLWAQAIESGLPNPRALESNLSGSWDATDADE